MNPEIREMNARKLIGMRTRTSLASDEPSALWKQFMPRRREIKNRLDSGFYSVQVYDGGLDIGRFTPDTLFEKWAAVEVADFDFMPAGMHSHTLAGGTYAVFIHKGPTSTFSRTTAYIFGTWLPGSGYQLDDREHFQIMGDRYLGPDNPDSEEEVWIPIKKR